MEDAVHVAVDDLAADLGLEPEAEDEHQEDAQRHAQDDDAPEQDGHDGGSQRVGQEGDHAVQAVLQRLVEGLVQQDHLRPHVGEQHVEQHQVQHRGHPHGQADVGAVVQHVEAEIDEEDLDGDDGAVDDAGQDGGFEVPLERAAVGGPPVARFIAQGAEHGVVHARQCGAGQNAARNGADHHDGEVVHQKTDIHQADNRQKADAGEKVSQEHAGHVAPDQLKKAADARFAGGVLLDARSGLAEIICRRKKTHFVSNPFWFGTVPRGRRKRNCPLCYLSFYKYTRIL